MLAVSLSEVVILCLNQDTLAGRLCQQSEILLEGHCPVALASAF